MSWRRLRLACAVALTPLACGKTSPPEPAIRWHERIAPACAEAKRRGAPVLFVDWAEWDIASKELDTEVFADDRVKRAMNRDWVALRVDRSDWYVNARPADDELSRENEEAVRRFHPSASKYATVILLARDCAHELDRVDAVLEPRAFAGRLDVAKRKI